MVDVDTLHATEKPSPVNTARHGHMVWFSLLLAMTNLMWASQGVAVKYLNPFLKPVALTFLPFYITTVLLVPLLIRNRRRNPHAVRPTIRDWKMFVIAGVLGQATSQLSAVWGLTRTTVSNASILYLLIPVMTAVLAPLMLRERLTRLQILCLLIGLVGVLLMSMQDLRQSAFINRAYLLGNLLVVIACLSSSFYNVYCKGLMERFGELDILIYSYITASLVSLPVLIWKEPDCLHRMTLLDGKAWAGFAFLSVFMYGVSMLLFFSVLKHVPVTVAAASFYLLPVFGVLLAMILVGERMNLYSTVGAGVVLVSTIVIMRYDAKQ